GAAAGFFAVAVEAGAATANEADNGTAPSARATARTSGFIRHSGNRGLPAPYAFACAGAIGRKSACRPATVACRTAVRDRRSGMPPASGLQAAAQERLGNAVAMQRIGAGQAVLGAGIGHQLERLATLLQRTHQHRRI